MRWWPRQRLGGVLLVYFISVRLVCSLKNASEEGIPEMRSKFSSDDRLFDSLMRNCKVPSITCIQKTLYDHLNDVLDRADNYELNGFVTFTKNNASFDGDNVTLARRDRAEEIGNKVLRFILTHNVQIQMPELMFEGSTLEISPRSVDGSGLITKLELIPKVVRKELGSPRIFFKKIKKFIGEKLMHALLAIVLVIALLLIKFLFFLPLVAGVAVAKKVLVKILLFFFPFLSHLFKLCPYVDHTNSLTKFHHHHHQISHLHHVPPLHHHLPTEHHPPHDPHQSYDIGFEYYGHGPDISEGYVDS
ncbi:uncharacterized protein LOC116175549 [Photinus pyralis]|uniref:uncharacterized protein LOC116175549 n=1 Tax=Photinus pyralis TaxID=7054 RepID=UPI0012674DA6|nr:uncharacterized protein LOC116175549 [Photinus pyralis]